MSKITIATRKSRLALWQAEYVQHKLQKLHPQHTFELLPLSTKGDEILDRSLAKIGGKGLFIKELESALLAGTADLAVHSLKDVPMILDPFFKIAATFARDMPEDVWVSPHYPTIDSVPPNHAVGTSSLRRQSIILNQYPQIKIVPIRGNLDTRLEKIHTESLAGIVLARAGLERLNYRQHITQVLDINKFIPAVGQGALAIETMASHSLAMNLVSALHDPLVGLATSVEREVARLLDGSCQMPLGVHAQWSNPNELLVHTWLASADGQKCIRTVISQTVITEDDATQLAHKLTESLYQNGAESIIKSI